MKTMKFRKYVNGKREQHIENTLPLQRFILKTKQLSYASGKIQTNCEMIIKSFKECEITTVVNCSKDDISQHKSKMQSELHLQTSSDDDLETDSSKKR